MSDKDYTAYFAKPPTATHEFYATWLLDHTGVEVEVKAVQLAVNLYADFQKSPEWIAERDRIKAETEAAKLAAAATRKPGTTKAEREAKAIAAAIETLKAKGIDVSGLTPKAPVASVTELPGNPVVEAGAVVETPAEPTVKELIATLPKPAKPGPENTQGMQESDVPTPKVAAPKSTARKSRATEKKEQVNA